MKKYIDDNPDQEFGERLKEGFVKEYRKLVQTEDLRSDLLFESLLEFSSGGSSDFKRKAAGLSVLSYLFEKCDVFET